MGGGDGGIHRRKGEGENDRVGTGWEVPGTVLE